MNDRERFLATVLGQKVDRPPFWLFWGPWGTTWQRWIGEGKPVAVTDHRSFAQPDAPPHILPVNMGPCPAFERQVLDETDQFIVATDSWGIVRKDYKLGTSMPEFVSFPIKNRADWERYKRERLDPDHPQRLAPDLTRLYQDLAAAGTPVQLGWYPYGLFGGVRWLLGDEECLMAFAAEPDLIQDMMDALSAVMLRVFEKVVAAGVRVDVFHFWEDMCGRQGPLISPAHWRQFMGPGYRAIAAYARAHDCPVISVDTDGQPDLIIPPMMETGVNYLMPFEVAAGCNIHDLQDRYPDLAMFGGIDKRALALGPAAIDHELARIEPAIRRGRYIPDLDHLVPDDVSWANYEYYAHALRRLVMG